MSLRPGYIVRSCLKQTILFYPKQGWFGGVTATKLLENCEKKKPRIKKIGRRKNKG
jgi:hypothetical protein